MKETVNGQLQNVNEVEKKVLSLLLNYIPLKLEEAQKAAQNQNEDGKYGSLPDFYVCKDEESKEILYCEIDPEEWTYKFNEVFNEKLGTSKIFRLEAKSGFLVLQRTPVYYEEPLWKFGDILVKLGIGYWTHYISAKGYLSIKFIIPVFLYEHARKYKGSLPEINREVLIQSIKKEERRYDFTDFEEEDIKREECLEVEVENAITNNPEILEEGLRLIERQKPTDAGIIDLLCLDKNNNYVRIITMLSSS
jgi:hypothetical protein